MLLDVRDDDEFQRYLDQEETRLHKALWPVLAAGVRLQVNVNSVRAQQYVTERGEPVLNREYQKIYRDQYNAITDQVTKDVSDFLTEQSRNLLVEASRKITGISESLRKVVTDLMLHGVAEGKSNQQIAKEIVGKAPDIAQSRAATIARTETHNSALAAIDAALVYKKISVKRKTWWTAQDRRTRQSHSDVHGTSVPMDEAFEVGDALMLRPGDQSMGAGAEEVVNCRCALLYHTDKESVGPASDLYRPPTKTAAQIVAQTGPGTSTAIAEVERKLAASVPTDALVDKGGFKLPDGKYTPQREALHRSVIEKIFSPEAIARARPAEGELPMLTMLGGRGGSGKSWLTGPHGPVDATKAILIDSDAIKAMLPGFAGWNAALYHEESSDILKLVDNYANKLRVNVIHDATMKTLKSTRERMKLYQDRGYTVEGFYMYLSPEAAAGRAMSRFSKGGTFTGRFVPPEIILGNTQNEKNFDSLIPEFRRWGVYDNSGKAPKLVAKGKSTSPAITVEQRLEQSRKTATDYVIQRGRETGKEHLRWIDAATGELQEDKNIGSKNFVGIPPGLEAAWREGRKVEVHHNHPSDASFSAQDLFMVATQPHRLYAEGHLGSVYVATDAKAGVHTWHTGLRDTIWRQVIRVGIEGTPHRDLWISKLSDRDQNRVITHATMVVLHGNGWVNYSATLARDLEEMIAKNQNAFDALVRQMRSAAPDR